MSEGRLRGLATVLAKHRRITRAEAYLEILKDPEKWDRVPVFMVINREKAAIRKRKQRARQTRHYQRLKSKKLCVSCGRHPATIGVRCDECTVTYKMRIPTEAWSKPAA